MKSYWNRFKSFTIHDWISNGFMFVAFWNRQIQKVGDDLLGVPHCGCETGDARRHEADASSKTGVTLAFPVPA